MLKATVDEGSTGNAERNQNPDGIKQNVGDDVPYAKIVRLFTVLRRLAPAVFQLPC